jgi:hypothetical protein
MTRTWTTPAYLHALKIRLGITERQAPAWNACDAALSRAAGQMLETHETV